MSIFSVGTYYVKPENRNKFLATMEKLRKYMTKNKKMFRGVKSWRLFSQIYGGTYTAFVDIWEYDNMAVLDRLEPEWMSGGKLEQFGDVYLKLVEGQTMSWSIWNPVLQYE
jgi:hypothetical protein